MAEEKEFVCSHCRYVLEARSAGTRYFRDDMGKPQFLPTTHEGLLDEHVARSQGKALIGQARRAFIDGRTGSMSDMLCLACGSTFKRDLEKEKPVCPRLKCKSPEVITLWQLEGKTCPSCKTGKFKGHIKSSRQL